MKTLYLLLIIAVSTFSTYNVFAQCATATNINTFIYNGTTYEVVREQRNWATASSCAVSRGGHLVEINNVAEQTAVYNGILGSNISSSYTTVSDGGGIAYVWIGGNDINTEGQWVWHGSNSSFWSGQGAAGSSNGSPVSGSYNNWGKRGATIQEPDNYLGNQDAAAIALSSWPSGASSSWQLGSAGQWNDISVSNTLFYVIELDCTPTSSSLNINQCSPYTSPSGNHTWNTTGTYTDTLTNAAGCDSVITINATINQSMVSQTVSVCESYTSPSGSYTWNATGVYTDTLMNVAGCDSIITVNLTITPPNNYTITNEDGILTSSAPFLSYQWIDCSDSSLITGANDFLFTATQNGDYAAIVFSPFGVCVDTSECFEVIISSINNDIAFDMVDVYPNPTKDGNVTVSGVKTESIQIFDLLGKQVAYTIIKENANRVVLQINQPQGVYFIRLEGNDKSAKVIKLFKQ